MDSVGKRNHVLIGGPHPPEGKRNFVEHDDSTMNIVVVIIIIIFLCHGTLKHFAMQSTVDLNWH